MIFNISCDVVGKGKVYSRLNYSKTRALNPVLKVQNAGYAMSDCPIAAIEYQGFSPNKIINIQDKSDLMFENSETFYIVETIKYNSNTNHYDITHYPYNPISSGLIDYLVTGTRSDNQNGTPLFYQYELLYDAYSQSSETLISNIYKNNENIISKNTYAIELSNDLISAGSTRYDDTEWNLASGLFGNVIKRCRVLLPIDFSDNQTFYTVEYDKVVNGTRSYQRELIELKPLYKKNKDYTIDDQGLMLSPSTTIFKSDYLNIIKDPRYRIFPLDIATIKDQDSFVSYVSDAMSSWNIRLNIGSLLRPSGFYTNSSDSFYYLPNTVIDGQMIISNAKPELIGNNILKLKAFPIFIDTSVGAYSYPDYNIPMYDDNNQYLNDTAGKIAIVINGTTRRDIKILSIDREKGFLYLDTDLFVSDEIEVSYYIENESSLIVENLELNPKVNDNVAMFHVSGYMDNGLGLAIMPYDGSDDSTYPYIYDLKSNPTTRQVYSIPPIGEESVSRNWVDHDFFTIAELNINKLVKDIIKLTDARKVGGGVDDKLIEKWFIENHSNSYKIHESEWYTNRGFYDGEPLASNGSIIIHVPEERIDTLRQKWIDYYVPLFDNNESAIAKGTKEFNYYLDQVIKRFISAGSDYILIPTVSGVITDILTLD